MRHNNILNISRIFILALSFATFVTCDSLYVDCDDYDFSDCFTEEPYEAELIMKISQSLDFDSVRVILFEGVIEDNDTIDTFIAEYAEYYNWQYVDKKYSAVAKYYIGDQTINVVDGDKLRTSLTSRCDEACYIIKGNELDLELEYINIK